MIRAGDPPVALTIAGSDSGAGAGIQADLKAMSALGVFATTAVTVVTAQNTRSVVSVHPVPSEVVDAQIGAILDDFEVRAAKTGLLGSPEVVAAVAARARAEAFPPLVVDPVLVASTGRALVTADTVDAYREELLATALVVTPNVREAAVLAGTDPAAVRDVGAMAHLARRIHRFGPRWVLVKGGHLPGIEVGDPATGERIPIEVPDVLFDGSVLTVLDGRRVETVNTHGTGCTLSAALTAYLALGADVAEAAAEAKRFVRAGLEGGAGWRLGRGHGPLDPFGWSASGPPRGQGWG